MSASRDQAHGAGEPAQARAYLTPYHLGEQNAPALLGPVGASLRELELRTDRYADRLTMTEADRAAMRAATRALAAAREEIERLGR